MPIMRANYLRLLIVLLVRAVLLHRGGGCFPCHGHPRRLRCAASIEVNMQKRIIATSKLRDCAQHVRVMYFIGSRVPMSCECHCDARGLAACRYSIGPDMDLAALSRACVDVDSLMEPMARFWAGSCAFFVAQVGWLLLLQ